jgi:Domain of unknown function DUF302
MRLGNAMTTLDMTNGETEYFAHEVTRLTIPTGQSFAQFRQRYEAAVPALDPQRIADFVRRHVSWNEIVADAASSAPHGFFLYWRMDDASLMSLAGHTRGSTQYLMGNHTIAERMLRHAASVMLYAPLRTLLYEADDGSVHFVIDRPSTVFSSFDNAAIAAVGVELDQKLAALLGFLQVRAPAVLGTK